jgi:GT2 family glycosyltransferase
MSDNPTFSVIIPTYNRNDLLAKCLDCIAPGVQLLSADQYEVIVSDDGRDTTAEEMIRDKYPWVKWVSGASKGPAANRNNGASYAKGEWLVFTDDDCLPSPQWLNEYSQAIKGTSLALEGAIHPLGNLNQDMADCPVNLTGGCFWSANIAIKRLLFEKIKGFDLNYSIAAHEDQDLKIRIELNANILFVPNAVVIHPVRILSLSYILSQQPKRCRAFAYHARKNRGVLGYANTFNLMLSQYKFHLVTLKQNASMLFFKRAILSFYMLFVGIPLALWYFNMKDQHSSKA